MYTWVNPRVENQCEECNAFSYSCATCKWCNFCTSCTVASGEYLRKDEGYCYTSCPAGFTDDPGTMTCLSDTCDPSCGTCFGPDSNHCDSCNGGDKLYRGTCLPSCPLNISVENGAICEECYKGCATCTGTLETQCSSCQDEYFLDVNKCVFECPATKYKNHTTKTCDPCDGSCERCTGPSATDCVSCTPPLLLNDFTCNLTSCPDGKTLNPQ